MGEKNREDENPRLKIGPDILQLLSKFAEIELEDVEIEIGDLEISIQPSIPIPIMAPPREISVLEKVKPTELLQTEFRAPKGDYPGQIVEVKLGATKGEGGSRCSHFLNLPRLLLLLLAPRPGEQPHALSFIAPVHCR